MRHITELRLEAFQGYIDETIFFTPGFNLIVGTSDAGKSAILRAISLILYNKPRSKTLIHYGFTEARITAKFNDGTIVTRIIGDRNAIIVIQPDGTALSFDNFDTEYPEEVKKALGNPPIDEFNGAIAYADQFAPMFLVNLSPTNLPRSLSNLTGVEILEKASKELMQSYKAAEKEEKAAKKECADLENELVKYLDLETLENKIQHLSDLDEKIHLLDVSQEKLEKIIAQVDINASLETINYLDDLIKKIDCVLGLFRSFESIENKLSNLKILRFATQDYDNLSKPEDYQKIIDLCDRQLKKFREIDKVLAEINQFKSINNTYENIRTIGKTASEDYSEASKNLTQYFNELQNYKKLLIEEKLICETCERPL